MADGNAEAKQLRGLTIIWLSVGIINSLVLALLLFDPVAGGGAVRIGLAAIGAALGIALAVKFARQRQRLLDARHDGDRR
jgi:hypothetical protein